MVWLGLFDLRPCQHDNGYLDGQSQIKVHIDERTQVHSAHCLYVFMAIDCVKSEMLAITVCFP
jgi:hypothetical protein